MNRDVFNPGTGTPEDMFLAWFFGLPDGANIGHAALSEIARIDSAETPCERLKSLRGLLHQATLNMPHQSRHRRQRRH